MGSTINISLKAGIQPREIREKLQNSINPELLINHYQCQSLNFWKNIKMTRGDADANLSDDGRTLQIFKEQDLNDIDDFKLLNQNKEIKYMTNDILNIDNLNENNIEYKNTKEDTKSINEYLIFYIDKLKNINKTFLEIDYKNNKINNDLIRNKWNGFIYTTDKYLYENNLQIFNSRYSKIKFELLVNNLNLINCDVLLLINNLTLSYQIWKLLLDTYYHLQNPKIVVIEVNNKCNILDNNEGSFIDIIKIGLNKKYTPVLFTHKYLMFIVNEYIHLFNVKISKNPYDYLYLYNNLYIENNILYTNEQRNMHVKQDLEEN